MVYVFLNLLVALRNFSNNEIQKDDTGHQDCYYPCDPENDAFILVQMRNGAKIIITKRKSHGPQEVGKVEGQMSVLESRIHMLTKIPGDILIVLIFMGVTYREFDVVMVLVVPDS